MSQAQMSQTFVVEVTEKPEITPETAVESLAKAFNIPSRKIELMLKRLPGVATKPITEQEAAVVVTYFEQAGLKAIVKLSSATNTSAKVTSTPDSAPPSPVVKPATSTELPSSSEVAKPQTDSPAPSSMSSIGTPSPTPRLEGAKESPNISSEVAVAELPQVEARPIPQVQSASPDLLKALSEAQPMLSAQPFTPPPPPKISFTPVPPPRTTRTEHDILRTTLIGEPDPRKTYGGQDVYGSASAWPTAQRSSLSNRIMLTAILPTVVTLLGTLAATALFLFPLFNEDQQQSLGNPAVAIAASLSSVLTPTQAGEVNYDQLQNSIEATRLAFENTPVALVAVTDDEGAILPASWFESSTFSSGEDVRERITEQASSAISGETLTSTLPDANPDLEFVAQPLMLNGQNVGAVVVGMIRQTPSMNFWQLLGRIALFSLIPFALATLLAVLATRPITNRIHYLTQRAEEISRGQLSKSIEMKGNDELSALAEALERLRVSMQGALERLRRRR
jgi:HAMP domain-containing protein